MRFQCRELLMKVCIYLELSGKYNYLIKYLGKNPFTWCTTNFQSIKMIDRDEVWKVNKIQLLKMSNKLLDYMTGTWRYHYNDNNIIMIRILTVIIIPIATISSLLSILQTLACSLISMLLWSRYYNSYFIEDVTDF